MSTFTIRARAPLAALALLLGACADAATGPQQPAAVSASQVSASQVSGQPNQLVSCPTTRSYTRSGWIGPKGGSLSVAGTTITLPKHAVKRPTYFTLTVPASTFMEIEITARGYEHFVFDSGVSIDLDYSRCGDLDMTNITAAWIDVDSKSVLQEMGGSPDHQARKHRFGTDHLSGYSLVYRKPARVE